jgi:hypothetical protein
MSVKSIYLLFGSEKFQRIINDWFNINKDLEIYKHISNINKTDSRVELYNNNMNHTRVDSILKIFEQVIYFDFLFSVYQKSTLY